MTKRKRKGECTYCGRIGPITSDHIPPKCLFPHPRPDLITVPSCRHCNKGASLDDEYFRTVIALRDTVGDNPNVQSLLPLVLRSLKKPQKAAFRHSLLKSLRKLQVRTPAGLILGNRGAYDVDLVRLDNVASRIVRGLYFHESGQRLPDGFAVSSFSEDGLRDLDAETLAKMQQTVLAPLLANDTNLDSHVSFLS